MPQKLLVLTLVGSLALLGGCTKHYTITCDLTQYFTPDKTCTIGAIVDELPVDTKEGKKPTAEDIAKFKNYLFEEITSRDIITLLRSNADSSDYEIRGSILEYKKGSGVVRAVFGSPGNAECVVDLRLVEAETGQTIFGGNFTATVSDWAVSGDKIFKQISADFTRQLEEQLKDSPGNWKSSLRSW